MLDLSSSNASRVWLAVSRNVENICQLVVLKTVAEARVHDAGALRELLDEARLTARMNHPNVVSVHGLQRERSLPFLVLEHLSGPSLATLIASAGALQRFSLELRVAVVVRLLRALDHVHRLRDFDGRPLRVVHGAVSPENIIVTYDGVVKLIDFGRARARVSRIPTLLDRRRLPYAPPEQFSGEPDARGDLFSAGVLLWELIANRPLWGSVPAPTIVRRLLAGDLPRLRDAAPEADEALDRICTRALWPQPDGRYRNANEMRSDLERFLASRDAVVPDSAIAALVCAACRDQRRETERAIEARLVALGLTFPQPAAASAATPRTGLDRIARGSLDRGRLDRGPPRVLAAAIVAAGLVIALVLALTLQREPAPDQAHDAGTSVEIAGDLRHATALLRTAPPPARATDATEPAAVARLVRLDVRVRPNHAVLSIDGQRLTSNPLLASMVWDSDWHILRGEAPGFETFIAQFRLDSDVEIDTTLRRQPSSAVQRSGDHPDALAELRRRVKGVP